jgi:hypothetical protein
MSHAKKKLYRFADAVRRTCACHRSDRLIADLRDRACLLLGPVACWIDRRLSA